MHAARCVRQSPGLTAGATNAARRASLQPVGIHLEPRRAGFSGKSGLWDEAVLWDTEPWMCAIFQLLSQQPPRGPLWPVLAIATIDHFKQAVLDLEL